MQFSQLAIALTMVAAALADGVCDPTITKDCPRGCCNFQPGNNNHVLGQNWLPCAGGSPCKKAGALCHLDTSDYKHAKCHREVHNPPGDE
ncbi:unnamed protein product [Zymoseptoria tritici ST99CH_1A5]|uniref:Uncharacterized protein n=2 Tax=Zymoseptoria tritici TaxID=1047171 RepID=A0A2H1FJ24_ZYMTR|nr:unnamed protein product [Zymoseptoria tritici ST99CH_1E4]SMY18646.1 unnamed protein product [Zymoseptoria tritici ST99CH_1A5]